MLTPQEVAERSFPKATLGGYNMAQVDAFWMNSPRIIPLFTRKMPC